MKRLPLGQRQTLNFHLPSIIRRTPCWWHTASLSCLVVASRERWMVLKRHELREIFCILHSSCQCRVFQAGIRQGAAVELKVARCRCRPPPSVGDNAVRMYFTNTTAVGLQKNTTPYRISPLVVAATVVLIACMLSLSVAAFSSFSASAENGCMHSLKSSSIS